MVSARAQEGPGMSSDYVAMPTTLAQAAWQRLTQQRRQQRRLEGYEAAGF